MKKTAVLCVVALLFGVLIIRFQKKPEDVQITQTTPRSFAERNHIREMQTRKRTFFTDAFGAKNVDADVVERVDTAIRAFPDVTAREYALLYDVHAIWVEYLKTNADQSAFLEDTNAQARLSEAWDKVEQEMGTERYRAFHETMMPEYLTAYQASAYDAKAASEFSREVKELREAILNADSQEEFSRAQLRAASRIREIFGDEVFLSKRLVLEQALGAPLGNFR